MAAPVICPQCHTPNKEGDKYCEQCGAPLQSIAPIPSGDDAGLGATVLAGPTNADATLIRLSEHGEERFGLSSKAVVGRLESNDIPINDKSVSREHARLSRLRDGYVIEDLGSTNGTMVNGQRINEAVLLRPGDLVTVGAVEFRYELESAPVGSMPASDGAHVAQEVAPAFQPFPPGPQPSAPFGQPPPQSQPEHFGIPPGVADFANSGSRQSNDPPTMHELPPVPVTFPPLEPFVPVEEEAHSGSGEASSGPSAPQPDHVEVPADSGQPEPVAAAAEAHNDAGPQPPHWTEPEPVHHRDVPSPQVPADSAAASEAADLIRRLSEFVDSMSAQLSSANSEAARLRESSAAGDEAIAQRDGLKKALLDVPAPAMPASQMSGVQDMLDALIHNPRDVEILLKIGQQSTALAAVVNEYTQLRRILDRMASQLGLIPQS